MTNPTWWQVLVDTALLGTERKAFDPAVLPTDLQSAKPTNSPEQTLLQTAALAANYLRAGSEPVALSLPDIPVCEPETKPHAPKAAMRLLDKILDEPIPNRRLLRFWLSHCVERGWELPPDKLTALLALGSKSLYADIHDPLQTAIGERGRWLCQFNTDWNYLTSIDPEHSWQEGRSRERPVAFQRLRQTDPAKALALLAASWPSESAKDRVKWMSLLAQRNRPDDVPFAESVLAELDTVKKPTAAHRDLRLQTVALLLDQPESTLFYQTRAALSQYMTTKRELLINKVNVLDLPQRPDTFFNEKVMTGYGFELDPSLPNEKQIRHWLYQLLSLLHPTGWTNLFGTSDEQLFGQLKRQSWFTGEGITHFAKSVIRHQLTPLARELVSSVPAHQRAQLLALLPQRTREDRLIGSDEFTKQPEAYSYLTAVGAETWSASFSEWLTLELAQIIKNQYQLYSAHHQLLADLVLVIHPTIALSKLAGESLSNDTNLHPYQQTGIQNQLVAPLARWLDLRQRIADL